MSTRNSQSVTAFDIIQRDQRQNRPEECDVKSPIKIAFFKRYAMKYRGLKEGIFPPKPNLSILVWSFIASFTGIGLCAILTYNVHIKPGGRINGEPIELHFLIASFGATAVLIYGTVDSPLSQPRNLVFGHFLSAVVGVVIAEIFAAFGHQNLIKRDWLWLECALGVSASIFVMQIARVVHPPGGATAIIAITSSQAQRMHGLFILLPVMGGVTLLLFVALVVNNIARQYPSYWWKPVVKDIPIREDSTHHFSRAYGEAFDVAELHPTAARLLGVSTGAQVSPEEIEANGVSNSYLHDSQGQAKAVIPSGELKKAFEMACFKIAALEAELERLQRHPNLTYRGQV